MCYYIDMAENIEKSQEDDEEILESVKKFASDYTDRHKRDIEDFKLSKNISSGNGFTTKTNVRRRFSDKALVAVNLLEPVVNTVVHEFTSNPFDFETQANVDLQELKFQLGTCLREVCIDGLSYLLTYKEKEKIKFLRLNNFNVVYGPCEYSDGSDAKECVYIDKKRYPKDKNLERKRSKWDGMFDKVLKLKSEEGIVLTYWRKEGDYVNTYMIENGEIVQRTRQELPRLPIVRLYGKEVFLDTERNWRGFYYSVAKIMENIDIKKSYIKERIFTAPNYPWLFPEESVEDVKRMSEINDIPKAFMTYKALSTASPGTLLPAPIPVKFDTGVMELEATVDKDIEIVMNILGVSAGQSPANETAEAVLLRREKKDTAVNEMIKNLLDSSYEVAEIITALSGGMEVKIQSDIFEKAKQNEDLQKIIALTTLLNNNPQAMAILPVIISKLDLPMSEKETILALYSQERDSGTSTSQEIEMLKQEITQLRANNEAQMATAQMDAQSRIETKRIEALMKDAEIQIKMKELQLKEAELLMQNNRLEGQLQEEAARNAEKNALEAAKHASDAEAQRIKLAQEATKISNAAEKAVMDAMKP